MAKGALKTCMKPGCTALTSGRYCDKHRPKDGGRRPAEWRSWYNSSRFRNARAAFMAEHPTCAVCGALATDLDHRIPHKGNALLFWDTGNWQALCDSCHGRKTASEDGGFGNARKGWKRSGRR